MKDYIHNFITQVMVRFGFVRKEYYDKICAEYKDYVYSHDIEVRNRYRFEVLKVLVDKDQSDRLAFFKG